MAVIVAGLFDSMGDATEAMDGLMRANLPDLETKVYETGSRGDAAESGPNVVIPVIPTTSGTGMGQPGVPAAAALGAAGLDRDWLNEFDEEERAFYYEGYREGATLALARVKEENAEQVRQMMRQHRARTFVKD